MRVSRQYFTPVVAAILIFFMVLPTSTLAQAAADSRAERLNALFEQLKQPVDGDWRAVERQILVLWSDSGSPAMNLLLERGRQAIVKKDYPKAIEHLSALVEQAPNFAEGWNARATAYFLMGDYTLAVQDIQTTLSLEPRHFGALAGLGMIFERVDRPDKALVADRAALAIHPFLPAVIEAVKRLELETGGTSL